MDSAMQTATATMTDLQQGFTSLLSNVTQSILVTRQRVKEAMMKEDEKVLEHWICR